MICIKSGHLRSSTYWPWQYWLLHSFSCTAHIAGNFHQGYTRSLWKSQHHHYSISAWIQSRIPCLIKQFTKPLILAAFQFIMVGINGSFVRCLVCDWKNWSIQLYPALEKYCHAVKQMYISIKKQSLTGNNSSTYKLCFQVWGCVLGN